MSRDVIGLGLGWPFLRLPQTSIPYLAETGHGPWKLEYGEITSMVKEKLAGRVSALILIDFHRWREGSVVLHFAVQGAGVDHARPALR